MNPTPKTSGFNALAENQSSTDLQFRFGAALDLIPIGVTPEGLRMAKSYIGTVTMGRLLGAEVRGMDHLVLRNDGVCVIDA